MFSARPVGRILWVIAWFGLVAIPTATLPGQAPSPAVSSATHPPFAIGFLLDGSDLPHAQVVMEKLRRDLLGRPKVVEKLERAGLTGGIELSPCYEPRDMVQRMAQEEFDLVFATAVVYARRRGSYVPVLQTYRKELKDFKTEAGWLRRGVLIAGPASPLFSGSPRDVIEIGEALAGSELAVPSSDSAAGYIYPTMILRDKYQIATPIQYLFCGSDAEVVKHVVSGLVPLGACREGTLQSLLPNAKDGHYYRIIFRTDHFPTDPVLLRGEWAPVRSDLGVELKFAIRGFFNQSLALTSGLRLDTADERAYEDMTPDVGLVDGLNRRRADPAATPSVAPSRRPTPTAAPLPRPALPKTLSPAPAASPTATPIGGA